jgi:hypothetical protein
MSTARNSAPSGNERRINQRKLTVSSPFCKRKAASKGGFLFIQAESINDTANSTAGADRYRAGTNCPSCGKTGSGHSTTEYASRYYKPVHDRPAEAVVVEQQ